MAFGNWHIPYAFSHCQKSQCECISIINLVQEEHATVTKLSALGIAMQVRIGRWRSTQIRWHILTVMSCRLSWMRMTHSSIWALQLQCRLLPGNREWRDIVENFFGTELGCQMMVLLVGFSCLHLWFSLETCSYYLRYEDMASRGLLYFFQHLAAVCNQIVIGSAQKWLTKRRPKRTSHPAVFIVFISGWFKNLIWHLTPWFMIAACSRYSHFILVWLFQYVLWCNGFLSPFRSCAFPELLGIEFAWVCADRYWTPIVSRLSRMLKFSLFALVEAWAKLIQTLNAARIVFVMIFWYIL